MPRPGRRQYVASCAGLYPTRIAQEIEPNVGLSGQTLVATFVSPPYGYAPDLVKACCAGLLRGKKVRIRPEHGDDIVVSLVATGDVLGALWRQNILDTTPPRTVARAVATSSPENH